MKLSLKNIKELKQQSDSSLFKRACNYVIDSWKDYDDKKHIFTDVLHYGCQSGAVGFLIYYSDTVNFYDKYKDDINNILYNALHICGTNNPKELFGDNWDDEDPLVQDVSNKNLLAWFGFEEALRNVGLKFEQLHRYI